MTPSRKIDDQKQNVRTPQKLRKQGQRPAEFDMPSPGLAGLQKLVGNRAVRKLIAQRSGSGPTELDENTVEGINRQRGRGQPLDSQFSDQAGAALGQDFSGVRVHTSREADSLTRQLGARAFTTGHDLFFKEGAYDPNSQGGQELIAHELTHVVQQASGAVPSGQKMAVTAAGDSFEQQADATADAVVSGQATLQTAQEDTALQMQAEESEEEEEEERTIQTTVDAASLQMQAEEPEEEEEEESPIQTMVDSSSLQMQEEREDEQPVQPMVDSSSLQMQEEREEEPAVQTKADTGFMKAHPGRLPQ